MAAIEYIIYEKPQKQEASVLENPTSDKPTLERPNVSKPVLENPTSENPTQRNTDRLSTEGSEAKKRKDNNFYHPKSNTGELSSEEKECYRKMLAEKLRPEKLKELYPSSGEEVDSFFDIAFRAVTTGKKTIRIGGEELPADNVRKRLLSLTDKQLEQTLKAWRKNMADVHNPRQYMLTMLYNAPASMN